MFANPSRDLGEPSVSRVPCPADGAAIRTLLRPRRSALVDIRRNNVSLLRSLRLCADFRAGEPVRLTIRLADLVVTEWVLGCGSQLLTRAHGLTTHLVLSLLHARSPALGPTSFPPASTSYDTPPPPSRLHCTPPATSPVLPALLPSCTPPSPILATRCVEDRFAFWPPRTTIVSSLYVLLTP